MKHMNGTSFLIETVVVIKCKIAHQGRVARMLLRFFTEKEQTEAKEHRKKLYKQNVRMGLFVRQTYTALGKLGGGGGRIKFPGIRTYVEKEKENILV